MAENPIAALRALPRYRLQHCNDNYMSRCYIVAVPTDGRDELMAGQYEWIRADELGAVLASSVVVSFEIKRQTDELREVDARAVDV